MPALCSTDEVMFRLQHGKLYREHTIAKGEGICDYWIVGDKVKNPKYNKLPGTHTAIIRGGERKIRR